MENTMKEWTILGPMDGFDILNYKADYITCSTANEKGIFTVTGWKRENLGYPLGLWWKDEIIWKVGQVMVVCRVDAEYNVT